MKYMLQPSIDPWGPLSKVIPTISIASNREVKHVAQALATANSEKMSIRAKTAKRCLYVKLPPEEKTEIGK